MVEVAAHVETEESGINAVGSLDAYMSQYGPALAQKVKDLYDPLWYPGDIWHPRVYQSLRRPYQGQGDGIMGAVEVLKRSDHVFVVGEMGTGKTLIGSLIPYVINPKSRTLIMCPGHLVKKWKREILSTVPGAEAHIVESITEASAVKTQAEKATGPVYWIVGKEKAKLAYSWKGVATFRQETVREVERMEDPKTGEIVETVNYRTVERVLCPRCGQVVNGPKTDKDSGETLPLEARAIKANKRKWSCQCGEQLWGADAGQFASFQDYLTQTRSGKKIKPRKARGMFRRFPIADYFKRQLYRGFFDYFIADEVHELKALDSAQGDAFGALAASCKNVICLTGTLMGGNASHLFHLNFRTGPSRMLADGYEYGKVNRWIDHYGVRETTIRERISNDYEDKKCGKGKNRTSKSEEKPGISPTLFSQQLIDKAVFLHLADVAAKLPELTEEIVPLTLDPEVKIGYDEMSDTIKAALAPMLVKGDKRLLSTYLQNLLSYPDKPFRNRTINLGEGDWYEPIECSEADIYPKEQEMVDIVESELAAGRRVLIYANFTGTRDVTYRFVDVLARKGIKATTLKSSVDTRSREQWIRDTLSAGTQVLICNPELVKTGLDLIEFPTIIFAQLTYNVFTLIQASRRSWRIGQRHPVKIYYLYYKETMQENAVALIGKKVLASKMINGERIQDGGLTDLCGDDASAQVALANSLAKGGVSGVEAVWNALKKQAALNKVEGVIPEVSEEIETEVNYEASSVTEDRQTANLETEAKTAGQVDETPKDSETPVESIGPDIEVPNVEAVECDPVSDSEVDAGESCQSLESDSEPASESVVEIGEIRWDGEYGITLPDGSQEMVQGVEIRLPGYEDFRFFAHNVRNTTDLYNVSEMSTGVSLGVDELSIESAINAALDMLQANAPTPYKLGVIIEGAKQKIEALRERTERREAPVKIEPKVVDIPAQAPIQATPRAKRTERRTTSTRQPVDNSWRHDHDVKPDGDYKWTKAGWRKVSERDKLAATRKAERIAATAWKYDGATNPGDDFYWVSSYSYNRTLKDGSVKTITVRGHWRKRRAPKIETIKKAA